MLFSSVKLQGNITHINLGKLTPIILYFESLHGE